MKSSNTLLAIAMLALGCSGLAQAQSCESPLPMKEGAAISGDTCTGKSQSGTLCGAFPSPENDIVYSITVDDASKAASYTLTNNTPGWNPGLVLLSGSCGGGVSCTEVADNAGKGGNETIKIPGAGKYFLIVTSSPGTGGCGSFTLSTGAPAKVKEASAK